MDALDDGHDLPEADNYKNHEVRCSSACTRAGITALVLAALAISILQPLSKTRFLDAARQYILLRADMEYALYELDRDECWNAYKSDNPNIEKHTLRYLMDVNCGLVDGVFKGFRKPQINPDEKKNDSAPNPLTMYIVDTIEPLDNLNNIILKLFNRTTSPLTNTMHVSPYFHETIYKWQNEWIYLITQKLKSISTAEYKHFARDESPNDKVDSSTIKVYRYNIIESVPGRMNFSKILLLASPNQYADLLTLEDIRQLSKKDTSTSILLNEDTGVDIYTFNTRINPELAGILIGLGLCITLFYFWIFQREAQSSPLFPFPGTLFSVFSKGTVPRVAFFLLIVIPAVSVTLTAWYQVPKYATGAIFAIVTVIICCLIGYQAIVGWKRIREIGAKGNKVKSSC